MSTPVRMTVDQVAAFWGFHRDQVTALIRAGKLKASNLGLGKKKARYLIRWEDVLACEERNANVRSEPAKPSRKQALPAVKNYLS